MKNLAGWGQIPVSAMTTSKATQHFAFALVFGVSLQWFTPHKETLDKITKQVEKLEHIYTDAMDPDCLWRKSKTICINSQSVETKKLDLLAKEFKRETLGYFDVHNLKGKKTYRDFSGLSQGLFIDKLRTSIEDAMVVDFAGDIFMSGPFNEAPRLSIADPALPESSFAAVNMSAGWMLAATSRDLGAHMWNHKVTRGQKWREDFVRVVLFANPNFQGARLDAWSTALVVGGEKLLEHLWKQKKYQGQWAYLVFDRKITPRCSPNISCRFDIRPRVIEVRWTK
jgi:hypothetical protein